MQNIFLKAKTRADIDKLVEKILRDLDYPAPPLRTEEVIECLKLDKRYYSTVDDGFLREIAHRITVGAKQVLLRPSILLDAIKSFSLKALYVPDRKRILIDEELPPIKQRWAEIHEAVHSIIPWHQAFWLGDTKQTLSPICHAKIEAEANYGTGRLLFLQDRFLEFLDGSELSITLLRGVASQFKNSITSTLWRAVEQADYPAVALISGHPKRPSDDFDPMNPCEYMVRSEKFTERFENISECSLFKKVEQYCSWATRGPLGDEEILLEDNDGQQHVFAFETFHNSYQALTLGLYKCPKKLLVFTG